MRNQLFLSAILITAILSITINAQAQTVPTQVTSANSGGIMPYNTYGGAHENISLATGRLNLQIPLVTLPGRNGFNFTLSAVYDSSTQHLDGLYDPDTGTYFYWFDTEFRSPNLAPSSDLYDGNWRFGVPLLQATSTRQGVNPNGKTYCYQSFIVTSGDGSKHSFTNKAHCFLFNSQGQVVPQPGAGSPAEAQDASGFRLDTANENDVVLHEKSGTVTHFYPTYFNLYGDTVTKIADKIEDTNGNQITIQSTSLGGNDYELTSITDTLGRQITIGYASNSATVSYKDSNGASQPITLGFPTGGQLTSITLPTTLTYQLSYGGTAGKLSKVTYPTGGYTRYDWGTLTAFWYVSFALGGETTDYLEVTARHVCGLASGSCSPSQEFTTSYSPTIDGTKMNNQYEDVTDALGNLTHYQFSYGTNSGAGPHTSPRELSRQIKQLQNGQLVLTRTIQTDYNSLINGNTSDGSLPTRVTTTLNDVSPTLVSKTESDFDTYVPPGGGSGIPIDNAVERREYDYAQNAPGNLLRRTDFTWLKTNSVNGQDYTSTAIHIMDRKASETVYDGQGNQKAQTTYEYDNYAVGTSSSGAVQHDSAFGTGYTYRGNLTAMQRWRNTDGAWLTTRNKQFDDAGNILLAIDPATNSTTFSYADSWGNTACTPSGGNAAAYPTQVKNALNQTTNFKYNSCAGTKASMTDPNLQPASYSYDRMNRLVQASYPDAGQTNLTYNESSFPLNVQTTKKITDSLNLITTVAVDGIGSVYQTQLNSDPDGVVYTDTTYDALERVSTVSNPHRIGSSSTDGITTYNYDALNRVPKLIPPDGSSSSNNVTSVFSGNCTTVTDQAGKQRKSCSDALGRLKQVFESPSGLNYETDYTYDALDNLTQVVQAGSRTRTFVYDSLSRLTDATNPESGHTHYTYDSNSNVQTRNDARNITTTYYYDALNRLTQKSYSDSTPTAAFFYDDASCCPYFSPALGSVPEPVEK